MLVERFGAERVAAAFLAELERRLPAPEELAASPEPRARDARDARDDRRTREERGPRDDAGPRESRAPRDRSAFEAGVWYEVNLGRKHRAEPRWLLPLICRVGEVSGGEIGAIDIGERATRFEITGSAVARFEEALTKPRERDENVQVQRAGDTPLEPADPNAPPARSKPARAQRPGKAERQAMKSERSDDIPYEERKPRPKPTAAPRGAEGERRFERKPGGGKPEGGGKFGGKFEGKSGGKPGPRSGGKPGFKGKTGNGPAKARRPRQD